MGFQTRSRVDAISIPLSKATVATAATRRACCPLMSEGFCQMCLIKKAELSGDIGDGKSLSSRSFLGDVDALLQLHCSGVLPVVWRNTVANQLSDSPTIIRHFGDGHTVAALF